MNLKPTSTYKMPKHIKMWLANYKDPHEYGMRKRGFIQAHLFAIETAKAAENDNRKKNRGGDQSVD